MSKITIMLTKENNKKLEDLAKKFALSKSGALRLMTAYIAKNNINLTKTKQKQKKEVRFTFSCMQGFLPFEALQKKYKNLNKTELTNAIISNSKNLKIN